MIHSGKGLVLKTSALGLSRGGNLTLLDSFYKANFCVYSDVEGKPLKILEF